MAESVGGCGITFSRMGRVGMALRNPLARLCSMPSSLLDGWLLKDREQGFWFLLLPQHLAQFLARLKALAILDDAGVNFIGETAREAGVSKVSPGDLASTPLASTPLEALGRKEPRLRLT